LFLLAGGVFATCGGLGAAGGLFLGGNRGRGYQSQGKQRG
jgi:hypothetical protein